MKRLEEAAKEYGAAIGKDPTKPMNASYDGFIEGAKFAQKWISIKDELPPEISTEEKQTNGNTFTRYTSYVVNGYFNNTGRPEAVKIAWFRPCVTKWDFRFDKNQYEAEFIITHWRPINIQN